MLTARDHFRMIGRSATVTSLVMMNHRQIERFTGTPWRGFIHGAIAGSVAIIATRMALHGKPSNFLVVNVAVATTICGWALVPPDKRRLGRR